MSKVSQVCEAEWSPVKICEVPSVNKITAHVEKWKS